MARPRHRITAGDAWALALALPTTVLDRGQPLNEAWTKAAAILRITARARGFLRELATETLRLLDQGKGTLIRPWAALPAAPLTGADNAKVLAECLA